MLVGMFAETFIHPGSGQSASAIDLPVAREATTGYPFLAGSSVKGAFRDSAEQQNLTDVKVIFGEADKAGQVLISDARLLMLPVRSLNSVYKWVTCPLILERLKRDMQRSGLEADFALPSIDDGKASFTGEGPLFLEERSFTKADADLTAVAEVIKRLIKHPDSGARVAEQLVVLSDNDFGWFANYGLPIMARNALDNKTKVTKPGALWYEETLPPDTLMYSMMATRRRDSGDALAQLTALYEAYPYLQAGGNETVGQGWFVLTFLGQS